MKITKRCGHCSKEFESEKHWNKLYCSHYCYQRAKVTRRVAKDNPLTDPTFVDDRFVATLRFPTAERLNREALVIGDDEYVKVIGMSHMWEKPDNVNFVKQPEQEEHTDVWVMSKLSPLDLLLRQ